MKNIRTYIVALMLALSLPLCPVWADDYDDAVTATSTLFAAGKYSDAAAESLKAVRLNPERYEAHFFGGLALYKLDALDLAQTYFSKALELAPDTQKSKVQEALTLSLNKKKFVQVLQSAESAEEEGMFAKAAREYKAAWRLLPIREDVGLKAAEKGFEFDIADSAEILYWLRKNATDDATKDKVEQLLRKWVNEIDKEYAINAASGWALLLQNTWDKKTENLTGQNPSGLSPEDKDKILSTFNRALKCKPSIDKDPPKGDLTATALLTPSIHRAFIDPADVEKYKNAESIDQRLISTLYLLGHTRFQNRIVSAYNPVIERELHARIGLVLLYSMTGNFEDARLHLRQAAKNGYRWEWILFSERLSNFWRPIANHPEFIAMVDDIYGPAAVKEAQKVLQN